LYNSYVSERRISEARGEFSTTVNRVAYGGERVVLTRHGKRVAAVVPIEDLELLESLEDAMDVEEVRRRLAQGSEDDWIDWSDLKQRLGL
jgi:prevent-host-death family protein